METQVQKANPPEFPGILIPVDERASPKSLRGLFDAVAVPDAQENEFAKTDFAMHLIHSIHHKVSGEETAEEKEKKDKLYRAQASIMKGFADLSTFEVVETLSDMTGYYAQKRTENIKAIAIDPETQIAIGPDGKQVQTRAELMELQAQGFECGTTPETMKLSAEQISYVDGVAVNAAALLYVSEINEDIEQRETVLEEYQQKLESGEMSLNEVPIDIQGDVMHFRETGELQMERSTPLDVLNSNLTGEQMIDAGLMPVNVVKVDDVTYDESALAFMPKPALSPIGP